MVRGTWFTPAKGIGVRFVRWTALRGPVSHRLAVALLVCVTAGNAALQAQVDTTKQREKVDSALKKRAEERVLRSAHVIKFWEVAAVAGGVAVASAADLSVRDYVQDHRSHFLDSKLSIFRRAGQPEVYATVSLGVYGVGLISGNKAIRRAGRRLVAAVAVAGGTALAVKELVGRVRPDGAPGNQYRFKPFSGNDAFPSGHTTAAFAVATSLADDIHNPYASVALYTAASFTAWSRINDNRHWFSDTMAGAALGILSAKLVNGHWQIFHIHPPGWLVVPTTAGVAVSLQF